KSDADGPVWLQGGCRRQSECADATAGENPCGKADRRLKSGNNRMGARGSSACFAVRRRPFPGTIATLRGFVERPEYPRSCARNCRTYSSLEYVDVTTCC